MEGKETAETGEEMWKTAEEEEEPEAVEGEVAKEPKAAEGEKAVEGKEEEGAAEGEEEKEEQPLTAQQPHPSLML